MESVLRTLSRVYLDGDYGVLSFTLPFWVLLGAWSLRRDWVLPAALLGLVIVTPVALLAFGVVRPLFYPRHLLWTTIPFFLLAACGINAALRSKLLVWVVLVAVVSEGAVKLDRYYETQTKRDWRRITAALVETVPPGGLALVSSSEPAKLIGYYLLRQGVPTERVEMVQMSDESLAPPLLEAFRSGRPVWLVVSSLYAPEVVAAAERLARLAQEVHERPYLFHQLEPRY